MGTFWKPCFYHAHLVGTRVDTSSNCLWPNDIIFLWGLRAVMATFIAENFPAELRATAASFSGTLAINLGFGLGPLAITYAATIFGWNMGYTYVGITPIILAAIIFMFLKPVPREEVF